ncbi:MAG: signal peptidase I [Planctomycetota bacterium]|nr:signal peptidase I [Planctomycetota bacterium]
MSGRGDRQVDVALARILARGPADVLAILDPLRTAMPDLLQGQEGALHALLQARLRRGTLKLAGRSERGLALYAAPEADDSPRTASAPKLDALPKAVSQTALKVIKGVRDEGDRGRILGDVVAHLSILHGDGRMKAFGPPRRVRQLLQRADRKKHSVFFTADGGDSFRRFVIHEGPWVLGATVLFLVVKFFVAEVYQIPSESMRPTLEVGDRVVVSRLAGAPDRWDIVVFRHGGKAVVKRLVGLGGEEIALWQGDVFIDGAVAVKPDAVREVLRFPYREWGAVDGGLNGWTQHAEGDVQLWTFDDYGGLIGEHDYNDERILNALPLFDGYLRVKGAVPSGGRLLVRIGRGLMKSSEQPDAVRWTLEVSEDTVVVMEERQGKEPVALETAKRKTQGPVELELAYVDGVVHARVGDWSWKRSREAPYYPLDLTVGAREASIREVALDSDVHYANLLILGVPTAQDLEAGRRNPHPIPAGHLFFLGDNSRDSKDSRSRDVGVIPADSVVGPVGWRIWPPARIGGVR